MDVLTGAWSFFTNLVGWFFDKLRALFPGIVGHVLGTLGIAFGSYNLLLPKLVEFIQGYLNDLSPDMISLLGALRVDQALTLIFSAIAWKMGVKVHAIRLGGTDKVPAP